MSIHIGAKPGEIGEVVLLPGDPLRAEFVAQRYLEKAVCHSRARGMLGYTGLYNGVKVSVQGTGIEIALGAGPRRAQPASALRIPRASSSASPMVGVRVHRSVPRAPKRSTSRMPYSSSETGAPPGKSQSQ